MEVQAGILKISAERQEEQHEHLHTEIRYGSFLRRIAHPEGADEQKLTARYDAGVIQITVPFTTAHKEAQSIPIQSAG